ncbi:uncharacterized domain 1-containing protein [Alteribacillus persepolensis]|uniref:Uncharacterized domain 1-containing protein n=1 Tax=Alteribacillus persepolensis TaxID=568899 RepID=A0A1G8C0Z7_9BACI|nr:PaaI family thioesterase [Alteribacillus persepolensis]SDH39132.1 uncharacterized domain 1-containing protein [Alteribacillus persepolensis]
MDKNMESVAKVFTDSPFWGFMGFEIEKLQEGDVGLSLEVREELYNVNDTLHGGAYAAMLDTTMGMTARSIENAPFVTIDMNVHYLHPIKEGTIYSKGRLINRSKSLFTLEAEVFDQNHQLAAHCVGSFKLLKKNKQ